MELGEIYSLALDTNQEYMVTGHTLTTSSFKIWKIDNFEVVKIIKVTLLLASSRLVQVSFVGKLQPVHLPAKMWKLHPGLKTKIKIRAIGHFSQKHSASCLLHFLLATLLQATWPKPQLSQ